MTRANFTIITNEGKIKLQCNSSAYPSEIMKPLLLFAISTYAKNNYFGEGKDGFYENPEGFYLGEFIRDLNLSIGHVGNPSYYYEIDFVKQTIKVWANAMYWVNAPSDWKERGWYCYLYKSNNYGYHAWRKGKLIYNNTFRNVTAVITQKDNNIATLKSDELKKSEDI